MIKEESYRIHLDWWGKCRTCKFWGGIKESIKDGLCNNVDSDLFNVETTIDGYCSKWDTFDEDTAYDVLIYWEQYERKNK